VSHPLSGRRHDKQFKRRRPCFGGPHRRHLTLCGVSCRLRPSEHSWWAAMASSVENRREWTVVLLRSRARPVELTDTFVDVPQSPAECYSSRAQPTPKKFGNICSNVRKVRWQGVTSPESFPPASFEKLSAARPRRGRPQLFVHRRWDVIRPPKPTSCRNVEAIGGIDRGGATTDIGCGPGEHSIYLEPCLPRMTSVTGLDGSRLDEHALSRSADAA